ncbi:MAG: T9SS type A sorting domain-containing protein, partial [Syntrophales bacterium]
FGANTQSPYTTSVTGVTTYGDFVVGEPNPAVVLSDNGTQVIAANAGVGSTNVVLHKSALAVTLINATLTGITCTTAGNYASADITNLKAYYSTSSSFSVGTSTLLSTLTTPDIAGLKTFPAFTSQVILIGNGYIYITADVATGATVGNTINLSALAPGNFTFDASATTGTTTAGGVQTISGNIVLSDNAPQVIAASVNVGTGNLILHKSKIDVTVTGTSATLTGMTCTTAGSYVPADITNLKVYYSTSSTYGTGSVISTLPAPGAAGLKLFPSFTQVITNGTPGYIYILADVAAGATVGNTINLSALTTSNFTFSPAGTISGTTTAGGAQTLTNTFYNKSGLALNLTTSWGPVTDGSGTAPANFTTANQVFNIYNGASATIAAAWAVTGANAKVVLGNPAVAAITFTVPSGFAFTGTIDIPVALSGSNTLTIQNATVPTFGALNSGSTVIYSQGAASTVAAATYGNLTINGVATFAMGSPVTVAGIFSLSSGTLNMSSGTLNVAGDFSHTSGTISGSGAIVFNGTSAQTYTTGGTVSGAINYTINPGATVNFGAGILTGSTGTFNLLSGGTIGIGHALGITASSANGNIQVTGIRTYGTGANYTYNRAGAQVTGDGLPATANLLTVSGTSVLTMSNSLISCDTLTINSGATLTIDPLKALTCGTFINNAGTFTIESDVNGTGSFISNGTITNTGTITVKKYLTGNRWWYIGSPVTSFVANAGSFGNALSAVSGVGKRLLYYTEGGAGTTYTAVTDGATLNTVLRGYTYKNFAAPATTVAFAGALNTGIIGIANNIVRTPGIVGYEGYNLVCNPYPSAIDFGVAGTGLTRTNMQTTIWYRSGSNYPTYNFLTGTGVLGGQQYIPAMQAFWVKVAQGYTTGTLIMDNPARVHSTVPFYKETSESNVCRMEVSDGTLNDEAVVGFYQGAADIFDNYDSEKMFSTDNDYPQIYTLTSDNTIVIINGLPELAANDERIVDLGFKTNVAGSFTLNATNMADFDSNIPAYLEDVQLNVIQDLRQSAIYNFSSAVVDDANRFKLHFGSMAVSITTISESSASVYAANNIIYVNTPKTAIIEVYDMLGNLIMNQQSAQGLNKLQLNVAGIYIVKVQTGTQITTHKVMISK